MTLIKLVFAGCILTLFTSQTDTETIRTDAEAIALLRGVSEKLLSIQSLRYQYIREMNYFSENHFSKAEASCYLEFDGKTVSRFQLASETSLQVFSGTDYFTLRHTDKTYERTEHPVQQTFANLSYFYNALPAMRSVLGDVARDDSITKAIGDTIIQGKQYTLLILTMKNRSIGYLGSVTRFTRPVTLYYTLVIDPGTLLPLQVIQRNNISPNDFTRVTYTAIDTKAAPPQAGSWQYTSYLNEYAVKIKGKETPLVARGTTLDAWQLPVFDGKQNTQIFKSADLTNKLVVLDFWIKNCGYCMESFVHLRDLQQRYGKQIEIITINALDPVTDVAFFHKREKPGYKMLYEGKSLATKLGIEDRGYPTVVITGKDGKVVYAGDFVKEEIESMIRKNL
jgi:thiol-disulfide isomerase/thioredoxin